MDWQDRLQPILHSVEEKQEDEQMLITAYVILKL